MSAPPVLFLVFNRPEHTRRVFEAIRRAEPTELFVSADGPRPNRPGEQEACERVQQIATDVDWPCDLHTLIRPTNIGCGRAVSQGLDWFFSSVQEGIVLEDDCLPSPSFFSYCREMLDAFRYDTRIMLISGYNAQGSWPRWDADYFYSKFGGIWGWASWRRAWKHYDHDMHRLQTQEARRALEDLLGRSLAHRRIAEFQKAQRGKVDTWDYGWALARHLNSGLATVPRVNLITNIGFDRQATHTTATPTAGPTTQYDLDIPLRPNNVVVADAEYDRLFHPDPRLRDRVGGKLKHLFRGR